MRSRWASKTSASLTSGTSGGRPADSGRAARRRDLALVPEALRREPQRGVDPRPQVLHRYDRGQLYQLRLAEVITESFRHLVGDARRGARHRLGVFKDQPLQLGENVAISPAGNSADFLGLHIMLHD